MATRVISKPDISTVAKLYVSGMSQREIADLLGFGQPAISKSLKAGGVTCRSKAARNPRTGSSHHNWSGSSITYKGAHDRVTFQRGRPKKCESCGTEDPVKWYDWANVSGKYHDPSDYLRLCRSCHRQFDKKRRAVNNDQP